MRNLVKLLSCLICVAAAAGHLGLQESLPWLSRWGITLHPKTTNLGNIQVVNQRQKFILDVLLQVQKPLVNTELIELGNTLITQPQMYTDSTDTDLLYFLEQCRNQDIVGHSDNVDLRDPKQSQQLIGLYKFLVLARDWNTFQRNLCFARLHINPILWVNALQLAVRDRPDTQNLKMPALNEILPELYYDNTVIATAENADWDALATSSVKPKLLDILRLHRPVLSSVGDPLNVLHSKDNLWLPWKNWRLQKTDQKPSWVGHMLSIVDSRNVKKQKEKEKEKKQKQKQKKMQSWENVEDTENTLPTIDNVVGGAADLWSDTTGRLVVPVKQQNAVTRITDDVGLNIFWDNIMTERLMKISSANQKPTLGGIELGDINTIETHLWSNIGDQQRGWQKKNWQGENESKNDWMTGNKWNDIVGQRRDWQGSNWRGEDEQNNWSTVKHWNDIIGENSGWQGSSWRGEGNENDWIARKNWDDVVGQRRDWQGKNWRGEDEQEGWTIGNKWGDVSDQNRDWQRSNWRGENEEKDWTTRQNLRGQRNNWRDVEDEKNWSTGKNWGDVSGRGWQGSNWRGDDEDKDWGGVVAVNRDWQRNNWRGEKDEKDWNTEKLGSMGEENSEEDSGWNIQSEDISHTDHDVNNIWNREKNLFDTNTWNHKNAIENLPETSIDNQRLLHVNRRKLNQLQNIQRTTGGQTWNPDDEEGQQQWWQQKEQQHGQEQTLPDRLSRGKWWTDVNQQMQTADIGRNNAWNQVFKNKPSNIWIEKVEEDKDAWNPGSGDVINVVPKQTWTRAVQNEDLNRDSWQNRRVIEGDRLMGLTNTEAMENKEHENVNQWRGTGDDSSTNTRWHNWQVVEGDRLMGRTNVNERNRRSIKSNDMMPAEKFVNEHDGEILIQNWQQLVARINMDKIALGAERRGVSSWRQMNPLLVNVGSVTDSSVNQVVFSVLQTLKNIIDNVLEHQRIDKSSDEVLNVIGNILIERNLPEGNIVDSIAKEVKGKIEGLNNIGSTTNTIIQPHIHGNIHNPINREIINGIVELIDDYRQHLDGHSMADLIDESIVINEVDIDRLITYNELVDTDLVNLLDQQLLQSSVNNLRHMQKKIVARESRLNHQPFTITYDITSKNNNQQPVVVRTLLGPKLSENGRILSLNENRKNFIQLDAFVHNLIPGSNIIERNSRDIEWTTRDVSTLSEIYQRVMAGQHIQDIIGSSCRFPHRLLLPRGTVDGLPIQILIAVTPVTEGDRLLQTLKEDSTHLCGLGVADLLLDNLPLGFPLDKNIENIENISLPNIILKDELILHYANVRGPSD